MAKKKTTKDKAPKLTRIQLAIQPITLDQIDRIAEVEMRTRADLIRTALRDYIKRYAGGV